jgi:hypothetical protein
MADEKNSRETDDPIRQLGDRVDVLQRELRHDLRELRAECARDDRRHVNENEKRSSCDDVRREVTELKQGASRRESRDKIIFAAVMIAIAMLGVLFPTVITPKLRRELIGAIGNELGQQQASPPANVIAGTPGSGAAGSLSARYREEKIKVMRPVRETSYREEKYTVQTPVRETTYREEKHTVRKPVYETSFRDETYTVKKPVVETQLRDEKYTVLRPVNDVEYQDQYVTVQTPIRGIEYRDQPVTVQMPETSWGLQPYCDYATGQMKWTNVPVTNYVSRTIVQKVPVETVRYVDTVETRKVPVPTTRYVEQEEVRKVPVEEVRYVEEQQVRKVPVETVRYVEEEEVRKVPVETTRYVEEEKTRTVPVESTRWVEEERTVYVPIATDGRTSAK